MSSDGGFQYQSGSAQHLKKANLLKDRDAKPPVYGIFLRQRGCQGNAANAAREITPTLAIPPFLSCRGSQAKLLVPYLSTLLVQVGKQ